MNIPNKVKIGGLHMYIRLDNNIAGADNCFGICDHMRGEIVLDSNQPQDHKEATLIHEIMEKINKENELNLEHNQITCIATQIHQVIKDNPNMFIDRTECINAD